MLAEEKNDGEGSSEDYFALQSKLLDRDHKMGISNYLLMYVILKSARSELPI